MDQNADEIILTYMGNNVIGSSNSIISKNILEPAIHACHFVVSVTKCAPSNKNRQVCSFIFTSSYVAMARCNHNLMNSREETDIWVSSNSLQNVEINVKHTTKIERPRIHSSSSQLDEVWKNNIYCPTFENYIRLEMLSIKPSNQLCQHHVMLETAESKQNVHFAETQSNYLGRKQSDSRWKRRYRCNCMSWHMWTSMTSAKSHSSVIQVSYREHNYKDIRCPPQWLVVKWISHSQH